LFTEVVETERKTMKPFFFGMNIDHNYPLGVDQKIQTKQGFLRFWDNGCKWSDLNSAPHVFNPVPIAQWVKLMRENGITQAIFEMGNTPAWAAAKGCDGSQSAYNVGGCCPPSDLNPDGTGANQLWKDWISFVLSVLPPEITFSFSPWNEFTSQPSITKSNWMWAGTNAQMARLCDNLYAAVKLVRPQAIVTTPSIPILGGKLAWNLQTFMNYWHTAGAQKNCDVIAVHPYGNDAAQVLASVAEFQAALKKDGSPAKPFWSTEGSWGATAPADPAQFVHDYVMGLYELVDRMVWYAYGPTYAALVNDQNVLTAAGAEWNKAVDSLTSVAA
jgi:hypothetical protein